MRVILFGASGMVGQAVLRACLADAGVEAVLAVVRSPLGVKHAKLRELVWKDFYDFSGAATELSGYDACLFCLGVSSVGMKEEEYRRVTFDLTMAAATVLSERSPQMTFIYISGAGTDSTERKSVMWARVKGETENALLRLPFRRAYMFRPGYIQPVDGVRSKVGWYRVVYALMGPMFPVLGKIFPKHVTTSARVGRAMLKVAREGFASPVVEEAEINQLGRD